MPAYRDYRRVPYTHRPPAMRILETTLGRPMEEIIPALFARYKSISLAAKALGISFDQFSNWMKGLGLYSCYLCSKTTGLLHLHTYDCFMCNRFFCDSCIQSDRASHANEWANKFNVTLYKSCKGNIRPIKPTYPDQYSTPTQE